MLLFRMINNKVRWLVFPDPEAPRWLPEGEVQSDALAGLKTGENALSVFEIREDADEGRIAVALAAGREYTDKIDYAVFDDAELADLGIVSARSNGGTPDKEVNELHYDLPNLNAGQIAGLARIISKGRMERKLEKSLRTRILDAINAGILDRDRFKARMKAELLGTQA